MLNGSYTTYSKDLQDFPIDEKALVMPYPGIEWQRVFFSPVYEVCNEEGNRIPDFRDLLYWNPDLKSDLEGKVQITFYTL